MIGRTKVYLKIQGGDQLIGEVTAKVLCRVKRSSQIGDADEEKTLMLALGEANIDTSLRFQRPSVT